MGCGSLRVHMHVPQDEPGRARAAEEQKHTGLQLVVFVTVPRRFSQGPPRSPLSAGYLSTSFFNLLRFYFFLFSMIFTHF